MELANKTSELSNGVSNFLGSESVPEGALLRILAFLQARHVSGLHKYGSDMGFGDSSIDKAKNSTQFLADMKKFGLKMRTIAVYVLYLMGDSNEMNTRDDFELKMKNLGYSKLAKAILGKV